MKFTIASLFVLASATEAFSPTLGVARSSKTALLAETRTDSSELIKEAIKIGKKFGAASPEARLAWEAVEEVDASDNSAATAGSLDEECPTEEEISKACIEYGEKIDELQGLLNAQQPVINTMKQLTDEIKAVRLAIPQPSAGAPSGQLLDAIAKAKELTAKLGVESAEAKVAWDTVEEISAAGNDNAMGGLMTDECLVEAAQEACEALEELNRVLAEANSQS